MAKLSSAERKKLSGDKFALPGKRMFPIHDSDHIKMAWDMVSRAKGLTDAERSTARRNILAAAKKAGIDTNDWDKKAITDSMVAQITILDDAGNTPGPLKIRCQGTQANVVNTNNRLYPRDVLAKAITDAIDRYVRPGRMVGQSPHPPAALDANGNTVFNMQIGNNVAKESNLSMDESGKVFFDAEIIPTNLGRDLEANIRAGVPVGVSMRALGNGVKTMIDGKMVDVATTMDIQAFDFVLNPATAGSGVVQVLTDSQVQTILDGAKTTAPHCPACDLELHPEDPDNDGDTDFYSCPGCGDEYDVVEDHATHHQAHQRVAKRDGRMNARWMDSQSGTAGGGQPPANNANMNQGDGEMTEEQIRQMILDSLKSPDVTAAMTATAQAVAKPALDAAQAAEAEKVKTQAKIEAKAFLDEKIAPLKGKLDDKVIKVITDAVGEPADKESAGLLFDAAMKVVNDASAAQLLAGVGFNGTTSPEGQTRIEFGNAAQPWRPIVDEIVKGFDRYGERFGATFDPKLRTHNKAIMERILDRHVAMVGPKAMADSVVNGDLRIFNDNVQGFEMMQDSASITTAQLLNQPTIMTAVLVQAFQDVESLQFLFADTFDGVEWRIPVETWTGAETPNPATGLMDFVVGEATGIPESAISLTWLPFQPTWRNLAVSLSSQVVREMLTGPAKYDAIARAIYHLGEAKRRRVDDAAYLEMLMASDEYNPTVVTDETIPANLVTAVSNGTNVAYTGKLTVGATKTSTAGANPIVRPRQKVQLQTNGTSQTVTINPFAVTVSGTAQVLGYLDGSGNVQSFAGTTATMAVDWENGVVYFTADAGLNPTAATPILPVCSYSAVTNYDAWHYTVPGTTTPEYWYNTFLQQLSTTAALMGSSPRFKKPNLAIMSLNAAVYIENAQIFYKLAQPEGTRLIPTGNYFGERSGMNLAKINAPWAAGDGRVLLTQKGSTRYGIQTPFQMEGPFPKYDSNQLIMDVKLWMGRENSVLCTPQVQNSSGTIINPVSRTIKIMA